MAGERKTSWQEARQKERNRNMLLVLIPVVIIILIAVLVLAGRMKDTDENTESGQETTAGSVGETAIQGPTGGETQVPTETESMAADTSVPTEHLAAEPDPLAESTETAQGFLQLKKDEIPEINELMKRYWNARINCDAETVYQIYGKANTNGIEAFRATMLQNARELRSVENVVCYTMKGMDDKSWVVFNVVDLKFRSSSVLVPVGGKCYVTQDEEGNFLLTDPELYSPELNEFMLETDKLDELKRLSAQTNKRTMEAVNSDAYLTGIYGTLHAGSPLWGAEEAETEPEVQVVE